MPVVESWKTYTVSTKATWGEAWVAQPNLICTQLTRAVMPTIDSAQFHWRTGTMIQAGESTLAYVAPLDLIGQYVRVEIPDLSVDWVGSFAAEAQSLGADEDASGNRRYAVVDQQFTAVGLEWLLSRAQVDSSVVYSSGGVQRIQRPQGYNTGFGASRSISSAARANKDTRNISGKAVFAEDPDHAELWSALDIVDHLLYYHGPRDDQDALAPVPFVTDIVAADPYLQWYHPEVQTEGRTVLYVLSQVIDRRRGLVWWFELEATQVKLHVSSALANSISLPGGETIPAAATSTTYNFDQVLSINSASVNHDGAQRYDRVRVRGARRRSVMTLSLSDGNVVEGWTSADETDYNSGDSSSTKASKNDRYRQSLKLDRVYKLFKIPTTWNGKSGDGVGGTQDFCAPLLAAGSVSILGTEPYSIHGLRVLRNTPLLAGLDYSNAASPTGTRTDNANPEFIQSFAIVKHDGKFVFLNRSARHIDEDTSNSKKLDYSYGMRPLANAPGIELSPGSGLPHALALNHFDPDTDAASDVAPEIDYDDIVFTLCVEWDASCEGAWPASKPTASPLQELVIYVGDRYRLDWLAKDTVFDIGAGGVLKSVTTGGPIQDDRRILEDLARLAYEYRSIPKASLDISFRNMQQPAALGTLITSIGTASNSTAQTINATVSQVTLNPEVGQSSFSAGYAELDFGGLV